jgi:hypothetical protein
MSGKSWRDVIKVHPAADLFPLMSPEELKALVEDIKKNGMRVPITWWTPKEKTGPLPKWQLEVLDGRNRLDALEASGVSLIDELGDANFEVLNRMPHDLLCEEDRGYGLKHGDPYEYVISANIHRRHLTAEQKREIIAKVIKAQPEKSDRQIAKQVKRDHKTVAAVRAKLEDVGSIPHVEKRTDTKGRKQPSRKKPKEPKRPEVDKANLRAREASAERIRTLLAKTEASAEALGVDSNKLTGKLLKAAEATAEVKPEPEPSGDVAPTDADRNPIDLIAALIAESKHYACAWMVFHQFDVDPPFSVGDVNHLIKWLRDFAEQHRKRVLRRAPL